MQAELQTQPAIYCQGLYFSDVLSVCLCLRSAPTKMCIHLKLFMFHVMLNKTIRGIKKLPRCSHIDILTLMEKLGVCYGPLMEELSKTSDDPTGRSLMKLFFAKFCPTTGQSDILAGDGREGKKTSGKNELKTLG